MTVYKFKKILSAGCSYIQGNELGDEFPFSQQTYPALIAKQHDAEYDCVAYASASNQGIVKRLFDYKHYENTMVIVQWTFPWRMGINLSYTYTDEKRQKQNWFDLAPNHWQLQGEFDGQVNEHVDYDQCSKDLKMLGVDEFNKQIYKHIGNNEYFDFATRLCIESAENFFNKNKIPYLFLSATGIEGTNGFEGMGFADWCDKHKFEKGRYGHPLQDAHESASQYIIENYFN